jgi:hypothetical protein
LELFQISSVSEKSINELYDMMVGTPYCDAVASQQ